MASASVRRKSSRSNTSAAELRAAGATTVIALTDDELLAVYDALVRVGAETRPGRGPANVGITPRSVIRHAAAVDSARRRVAYALAEGVVG